MGTRADRASCRCVPMNLSDSLKRASLQLDFDKTSCWLRTGSSPVCVCVCVSE